MRLFLLVDYATRCVVAFILNDWNLEIAYSQTYLMMLVFGVCIYPKYYQRCWIVFFFVLTCIFWFRYNSYNLNVSGRPMIVSTRLSITRDFRMASLFAITQSNLHIPSVRISIVEYDMSVILPELLIVKGVMMDCHVFTEMTLHAMAVMRIPLCDSGMSTVLSQSAP